MKSLEIKLNKKFPSKICCVGSNYEQTKTAKISELTSIIEINLKKLADKYYELGANFEVEYTDDVKTLDVFLTSHNVQALNILLDEIEHILWSYNKQILTQSGGCFKTRYLRFNYTIRFTHRKRERLK